MEYVVIWENIQYIVMIAMKDIIFHIKRKELNALNAKIIALNALA